MCWNTKKNGLASGSCELYKCCGSDSLPASVIGFRYTTSVCIRLQVNLQTLYDGGTSSGAVTQSDRLSRCSSAYDRKLIWSSFCSSSGSALRVPNASCLGQNSACTKPSNIVGKNCLSVRNAATGPRVATVCRCTSKPSTGTQGTSGPSLFLVLCG